MSNLGQTDVRRFDTSRSRKYFSSHEKLHMASIGFDIELSQSLFLAGRRIAVRSAGMVTLVGAPSRWEPSTTK